MSKLAQLQRDFQDYLMRGTPEPMHSKVIDSKPMTGERKLNVYYQAYRLRLYEALQIDYPKLEILLGEAEFYEASLAYIDSFPSQHFSVRHFGKDFEAYLKKFEPYNQHPVLAEMANFEWALMDSLDAKDAPLFSLENLKQTPPDQWAHLSFSFHPSVHTRLYAWDTPELWKDIEQEKTKRSPIQLEHPQPWLFWRKGLKSMYESLTPIQLKLYQLIDDDYTFGQMAERLCEDMDESKVPQVLLQHIQYWIEQDIFCKK